MKKSDVNKKSCNIADVKSKLNIPTVHTYATKSSVFSRVRMISVAHHYDGSLYTNVPAEFQ